MDRTNGMLDKAVIAYREDPTEVNRMCLMAWQHIHNDRFDREQTLEFQARTTGRA